MGTMGKVGSPFTQNRRIWVWGGLGAQFLNDWLAGASGPLGTCTAKGSVSSKQENHRGKMHVSGLVFTGNGPAATQGPGGGTGRECEGALRGAGCSW
jgi:hypothetical protein